MKREDIPNWDKLEKIEQAQIIACYPEVDFKEDEDDGFDTTSKTD